MRSRYLDELTTPDLEAYFAQGGDLALLPVGAVEMHGPHQPIGTDMFIARAAALLIARAADGIVLPDVPYTWAGATDGFAGTISLEPALAMQTMEHVLAKAGAMGFKRLALVNIHGPGAHMTWLAVRRVFENHRIPALAINVWQPLSPAADALFQGPAAKAKEASLVLGALQILGKESLYTVAEMAYDDTAPPYPPALSQLAPYTVGYFMQDPRQHACPSKHTSREDGVKFLELQAQSAAERLAALGAYIEQIKDQKNRGTWAGA